MTRAIKIGFIVGLLLVAALFVAFAARADGVSGGGGGAAALTRRTAPDANDQFVYALDEAAGAGTLVNTGALGSTYNLTFTGTSGVTNGYVGLLMNGMYLTNNALGTPNVPAASNCNGAAACNFANITFSGWVFPIASAANILYAIVEKPYRTGTTWTSPYESAGLFVTNNTTTPGIALQAICRIAVGATNLSFLSPYLMAVGTWHHVGCTYDGATVSIYVDGMLTLATAQAGPLDYGTFGAWAVGGLPTTANGSGMVGVIDDVRIANVVRGLSYFQTVWRNGMQIGGN